MYIIFIKQVLRANEYIKLKSDVILKLLVYEHAEESMCPGQLDETSDFFIFLCMNENQ